MLCVHYILRESPDGNVSSTSGDNIMNKLFNFKFCFGAFGVRERIHLFLPTPSVSLWLWFFLLMLLYYAIVFLSLSIFASGLNSIFTVAD